MRLTTLDTTQSMTESKNSKTDASTKQIGEFKPAWDQKRR